MADAVVTGIDSVDIRVLVVGEALVDLVTTGGETIAHPGGSPLNVAFGLGRLGVPTGLLTEFGDDAYGALLAEHLGSAGVRVVRPDRERGATSSAEAFIGADGAAHYSFDVTWTLGPLPPLPAARVIHTGSIGAVTQPGAGAVLDLFATAEPGVLLSFDPNVRPGFMGSRETVLPRVEALAQYAHIVKLSDEDSEWLYPGVSIEAVSDRLLDLGADLVVVTLGPGGCLLTSRAARVRRDAIPVTVVDTIGAGDSFMSALLYSVAQRLGSDGRPLVRFDEPDLASLADVALRSAAITVSRPGAMPPTLAELEGTDQRQFRG